VADRLVLRFGADHVFFDVDAIRPGSDFVRDLDERTANCDVLLAVIGKEWLSVMERDGSRRLDNPKDFVRIEIAAALRRQIRIIPILVSGARMPSSVELPPDLAPLAQREAIEIADNGFHSAIERLIPVLVREGQRRHAHTEPRPIVSHRQELRVEMLIQAFLHEAQRLALWLRTHRLVSALLFLLAVITFSPLWYRPPRTAGIASSRAVQAPRLEPSSIPAKPLADSSAATSDSEAVLHDFKTFYVLIPSQQSFNVDDVKHELQNHPDFAALKVAIVDDPSAADVILEIKHVSPGDFPFEVKSRKTGAVLLSNEGTAPPRGEAGAASIAGEFIKAVKPFRVIL